MAAVTKNRKRGWYFKKSSPLKLLSQLGQTLVEWSLGDPLSELYLMTPLANQDGRHSQT